MKAMLQTISVVLKDWRVIVIAIAVILYLSFYSGIVSYRKKPKRPPRKRKFVPPPPPKTNEDDADDDKR
jgi:hypothetical protein